MADTKKRVPCSKHGTEGPEESCEECVWIMKHSCHNCWQLNGSVKRIQGKQLCLDCVSV